MAQQRHDGLLQATAIGKGVAFFGVDRQAPGRARFARFRVDLRNGGSDDRRNVHRDWSDGEIVGVDPPKIHRVVKTSGRLAHVAQDGVGRAGAHRVVGRFLTDDLGPARNRVQRGPHVVRDPPTDLIAKAPRP